MASPARQNRPTILTARQRLRLLEKVFKGGKSVSSACREFGISRFTFYKWAKRYHPLASRNKNLKKLFDKKRKIKKLTKKASDEEVAEIKKIVTQGPNLSKYGIAKELKERLGAKAPGVHGVYNILKRSGLNTQEGRLNWSNLILKSKKRTLMPEQRLEVIKRAKATGIPVTKVCRDFGISRYTLYTGPC